MSRTPRTPDEPSPRLRRCLAVLVLLLVTAGLPRALQAGVPSGEGWLATLESYADPLPQADAAPAESSRSGSGGQVWVAAWELGEWASANRDTLDPAERERAVLALLPLAQADDPELRWVAVRTLGRLGAPSSAAVGALSRATLDGDLDVRWSAVEALGRVDESQGPTARAALARALGSAADDDIVNSSAVHTAACLALARLGGPPFGDPLAQRLVELARAPTVRAPLELRRAAATALALGAARRHYVAFVADLEARSADRRVTAAMALAGAPEEFGLEALAATAKLPEARLAEAATKSLVWRVERPLAALDAARPSQASEVLERTELVIELLAARPQDDSTRPDLLRLLTAARAANAGLPAPGPSSADAALQPPATGPRTTPVQELRHEPDAAAPAQQESLAAPAPPARQQLEAPPAREPLARETLTPAPLEPAEASAEREPSSGTSGWLWLLGLALLPQLAAFACWLFLPASLARGFRGRLPALLGLRLWTRTPRALDAWIAERAPQARKQLAHHPLASPRWVHVPLPVLKISAADEPVRRLPELSSVTLRAMLSPRRTGLAAQLSIVGEGGSGKTNLLVHIARQALSRSSSARPLEHLALPVFLDDEAALARCEQAGDVLELLRCALLAAFGPGSGELASELDLRMTTNLVRARRVLVLIDGLSEMQSEARARVNSLSRLFPALPLCVTTRPAGRPVGWAGHELRPCALTGPELAQFVDRYLTARLERSKLADAEFFEGCAGLVRLAHERPVTALVASLWADLWIARLSAPDQAALSSAPDSVFELFRAYAAQQAGVQRAGDGELVEDLTRLAVLSVDEHLRPAPIPETDALRALAGGAADRAALRSPRAARQRLESLVDAGLLQRSKNSQRSALVFVLDPLAEAFAAQHAATIAGASLEAWRELAQRTRQIGTPVGVAGYRRALGDALAAWRGELPEATWEAIRSELARDPFDPADPRSEGRHEALLDLNHLDSDRRLEALVALGRAAEAALSYAPEVVAKLNDIELDVRSAAADLCVRWGRTVVPTLVSQLVEARLGAGERAALFSVLGRLGPEAADAAPALAEAVGQGRDLRPALRALVAIGPRVPTAARVGQRLVEAWRASPHDALTQRLELLRAIGVFALQPEPLGDGGQACLEALVEALSLEDLDAHAAEALARVEPQAARQALPALCERLERSLTSAEITGREALARAAFAQALGALAGDSPRARTALEAAGRSRSELVAEAARSALAALNCPGPNGAHVDLLAPQAPPCEAPSPATEASALRDAEGEAHSAGAALDSLKASDVDR